VGKLLRTFVGSLSEQTYFRISHFVGHLADD